MVGWFIILPFYMWPACMLSTENPSTAETITGKKGIVVKALNPKGLIKINGSCGDGGQ
jgi:membrane-bound ClpP family serine protease